MTMFKKKVNFNGGTLKTRDQAKKDRLDKKASDGGNAKEYGVDPSGKWTNGPPPSLQEEIPLLKNQIQDLTVPKNQKDQSLNL